jgi:hypothetical protein
MGDGANYKTSIILNGRKLICHKPFGQAFPQTTPFLLPPALNACYAGYVALEGLARFAIINMAVYFRELD